jgi:soluble cytochrome b562
MSEARVDDSNAALRKLRTRLLELQNQIRELRLLGHEESEMSRVGYQEMMETLVRQRDRAERELAAMEKEKISGDAG